jgi:hypothetical protein
MINLNGLEEKCPKCNGKGEVENTTWYNNLPIRNLRFQVLKLRIYRINPFSFFVGIVMAEENYLQTRENGLWSS